MKNSKSKLILAVILIIGITAFIACEKGKNDVVESEGSPNVLLSNLNRFNNSFVPNQINQSTNSKGFWSSVGEVCKVAGADVIGAGTCVWATKELAAAAGCCTGGTGAAVVAGVSAVVGGAGASYAAAGIKVKGDHPVGGSSSIVLPPYYNYLNNVGFLHNSFLNDVYFDNKPQNQWLIENYNSDSSCVLGIVENTEWIAIKSYIYSSFEDYSISNYNYLAVLQDFENKDFINANIKNVLVSYMEVYLLASSFEDIDNISAFYISEVLNSNLSEIEKASLFCSFLVGANSPHFWLQTE